MPELRKLVLHPVKGLDSEDPEMAVLCLNYSEASEFLSAEQLIERVQSEDEDIKRKLRRLSTKENLLIDFIELNQESLCFEVYPAEILQKFILEKGFIIKGFIEDGDSGTNSEVEE